MLFLNLSKERSQTCSKIGLLVQSELHHPNQPLLESRRLCPLTPWGPLSTYKHYSPCILKHKKKTDGGKSTLQGQMKRNNNDANYLKEKDCRRQHEIREIV